MSDQVSEVAVGSSPLTRGKLCTWLLRQRGPRLIPAHAGKTPPPATKRPPSTAHPRSRGENRASIEGLLRTNGSSPLTRGKLTSCFVMVILGRLIPAHAGKTGLVVFRHPRGSAHPRSRGENSASLGAAMLAGGSSPLTRGKLLTHPSNALRSRLIPAHAGKTHRAAIPAAHDRAHPRSRGENRAMPVMITLLPGSSPLTRGKRFHDGGRSHRHRLIPAHAGKTIPRSTRHGARWAHPRSRGENWAWSSIAWAALGSSPLTRGKLS